MLLYIWLHNVDFCSVLVRKIVVSSANVSFLDSTCAKIMPVRFFVSLILRRSISTIKIKIYGKMTSPWGTPWFNEIVSDMWPPMSICASLL